MRIACAYCHRSSEDVPTSLQHCKDAERPTACARVRHVSRGAWRRCIILPLMLAICRVQVRRFAEMLLAKVNDLSSRCAGRVSRRLTAAHASIAIVPLRSYRRRCYGARNQRARRRMPSTPSDPLRRCHCIIIGILSIVIRILIIIVINRARIHQCCGHPAKAPRAPAGGVPLQGRRPVPRQVL